jgi:two-component system nitrate/nitrite response regulator NarL
MREGKTTIALVDDHPVVVEGAKMVFLAEPGFAVVATGGTAGDAIRIATTLAPDVMLVDLSMPGEVFSAITQIVQTTTSKVVVFTAYSSLDSALRALDAGALGFVLKGASFDEVLKAVQFALSGELYIAQQYASQVMLALRARGRHDTAATMRLNIREKQIVTQLLHARTNREIAATLHLSEKTVKRYMTVLMQKLHARNRVEVAIHAQKYDYSERATAEAALQ